MKRMQNKVFEINTATGEPRAIATFLEPSDAMLFVDAMLTKGATVYMRDYAGDRYPEKGY